jgi:hypothetical protein
MAPTILREPFLRDAAHCRRGTTFVRDVGRLREFFPTRAWFPRPPETDDEKFSF